jgi:hypothetical protein
MPTLSPPVLTPQHIERFWSRVTKTDTCWLWSAKGRGAFVIDGRQYVAARISFLIHHGRYPTLLVCHHCDNPRCVRPDHLFEGTSKDNSQDMVRKGRHGMHRCGSHLYRSCKVVLTGDPSQIFKRYPKP